MKPEHIPAQPVSSGRFYTIPQAARELGIPVHKLRRAVKLGVIFSYGLLDGRQYVRMADIHVALARGTATAPNQSSFHFAQPTAVSGGAL